MLLLTTATTMPETIPGVACWESVWVTEPVIPGHFVEALRMLRLFLAVVPPLEDTLYNAS
jgi:hypothetical protein